ncbi:MAG: hypothetical protein Q4C53_05960 [Clostridia bacterium]|nr:hypothetical protein [Clostridia bacterium]
MKYWGRPAKLFFDTPGMVLFWLWAALVLSVAAVALLAAPLWSGNADFATADARYAGLFVTVPLGILSWIGYLGSRKLLAAKRAREEKRTPRK